MLERMIHERREAAEVEVEKMARGRCEVLALLMVSEGWMVGLLR